MLGIEPDAELDQIVDRYDSLGSTIDLQDEPNVTRFLADEFQAVIFRFVNDV